MKTLSLIFLVLSFIPVLAQTEDVKTTGDISPAVIANNFSATYGVRPDAIEAILWIYEAEGYDVQRRKNATEEILKMYAQSPEKRQKKGTELSLASLSKIGITNTPKIASALEWDLFARNYYLSTTGQNSPAVVAKGDVNIWYGIPPKALRALATQLEKNKTDLGNFEAKLTDQVKKFEELKTELETYGAKEEIYLKAEALLEEGKLEEAERLIESDYHASKKRQAYKGFVFGRTKELRLKYEEAALGYKDAIFLDNKNINYLLYYAKNENTLAHYDEAIKHLEIALNIVDSQKGHEEIKSTLLNNLGIGWKNRGFFDKAIVYLKKALELDSTIFGIHHPNTAAGYNNLGTVWHSKGQYNKAIEYVEKALEIDRIICGEWNDKVARSYNNLGTLWEEKGAYDKAIEYYEKALKIGLFTLGEGHPNIATFYLNLGKPYYFKEDYDKAIEYYEKALKIDSEILGLQHPGIATCYNNLATAWSSKGEYDKAMEYLDQALEIDRAIFGERHENVARDYYNISGVWDSKGEYEKAIGYCEKALAMNSEIFGGSHPNVAVGYNNLGGLLRAKGEYDKAIGCYEKALGMSLEAFGKQNPQVGKSYHNLGEAWRSKGEFDKAIEYFEKALEINLIIFGNRHSIVVTGYNNIGASWKSKGEYDKAIGYYEKALSIDLAMHGEQHPNVAIRYNNLGGAWKAKGEYDKAIDYYNKAQVILGQFFEPTHPYRTTLAENLSHTLDSLGMKLFNQKEYTKALPYFQKALSNAEAAVDIAFSITCLYKIGSTYKYLENYEQGLLHLESAIKKAEQLNQAIDQLMKEQLAPEMLNNPVIKAKVAELKNLSSLRRMQHHKVSCLKGLKKDKEADALARQLWQEGTETNDTRLLEDLKKDGYDFGKD